MRSGARICAEALRDAGVRTVFGIPGQRILPLVHELQNRCGVAVVLTRHEQGAAFMADVYARVAGFGCCFATSGPGATNLLTGSAASYMDSVPMLAITAQAETTEFGRYGIQEGTGLGRTPDVSAMFAATCKRSLRPMDVEQLAPALEEAISVARGGRPGAVHVDIPSDLFLAMTDTPAAAVVAANGASPPPAALDPQALAQALEALRTAERPLLLAGNGVMRSGCERELLSFAEAAGIPIAGTFLAKAVLDERHPLVLGPVGIYGRPEANRALHHEADLVVALGVSFNYMTTAGWSAVLDGQRLIRVDIDERELTTNYAAAISISGDVSAFVGALAEAVPARPRDGAGRVAELSAAAKSGDEPAVPADEAGGLHPVDVCRVIGARLDDETTVIADVGQNAYWVERHLRTCGHGRFMINGGLGSMGHGVAGAIGASAALTDSGRHEHVLAICGDGGFMMGALEISTAVTLATDITWLIFNNEALGTQRAWFEREGHPLAACEMPAIDFVGLARSLGATGERISTLARLDAALAQARREGGVRVLDVIIDPVPAPTPFAP